VVNVVRPERLELYLQTVANHLKSLPSEDRTEIVRELRSHVLDRVKGDLSDASVSATLATLGDPHEIARINLRMRTALAIQPEAPLTVGRSLGRLAILGGRALLTFVFSLAGYAFSGCWIFTALAKPFAPDRVGLWLLPDATGDLSLSLGRRNEGGINGHDLLGWWIIPVGLAIGILCAVLTYRHNLGFIRRLRSPRSRATSRAA
jgi:hypothetical protein